MPHEETSDKFSVHARAILIQDECAATHYGIVDNFAELDLLRTTVEGLIAREESREVDEIAQQARALATRETADFWAENHPYWWDHIIAPQFRGAFFIALMSAVELHVGRIVRDAAFVANAPIDHDDLRGGFYPRVRKYLRLFCQIDSPPETQWQRVLGYYSVRNILVHNGGFVADGRTTAQVAGFSASVRGLSISTSHLEIEAEFCATAHQECYQFLLDLWGEVRLLCRRIGS